MSQSNCVHCGKTTYIDPDSRRIFYAGRYCLCQNNDKFMCIPCALTYKDLCPKLDNKCNQYLLKFIPLRINAREP